MTTANKITILRVLLVPFFVAQVLYYVNGGQEIYRLGAVLSFALCAASDGVDGYIARRYNQRSELGAILDPLADKLLLVSGVVLLSFNHQPYFDTLPLWLVTTILGRDALLVIGWFVIHAVCGKVTVRPRMLGKVATVLQMATVLWVLFRWHSAWRTPLCLTAALCTGVSGLFYVWDGGRQLSASPTSSASKPSPRPEDL